MKKLIGFFAGLLVPLALWAGDNCDLFTIESTQTSNVVTTSSLMTNATVVSTKIQSSGYLDTLEITPGYSAQTCTVVIVVATNYSALQPVVTVFSNTVTSGGVYKPRVPVCDTYGLTLGSASNSFESIYLVGDIIKVYCYSNTTSTTNCTIRVKGKLHR